MFACAKKGKKWFALDVDEAVEKTGASRERMVTALNYLEEQGDFELQVAGVRRGFRIVKRPGPKEVNALAIRLLERFKTRENNDIKRLQQVVSLVQHAHCKTRYLLNYFGEQFPENCGHCEYCLTGEGCNPDSVAMFKRSTGDIISEKQRVRALALLAEGHEALSSSRQQARFLCGIRSPKATRAKLHQHAAFAMLAHISFMDVLRWLGEYLVSAKFFFDTFSQEDFKQGLIGNILLVGQEFELLQHGLGKAKGNCLH